MNVQHGEEGVMKLKSHFSSFYSNIIQIAKKGQKPKEKNSNLWSFALMDTIMSSNYCLIIDLNGKDIGGWTLLLKLQTFFGMFCYFC